MWGMQVDTTNSGTAAHFWVIGICENKNIGLSQLRPEIKGAFIYCVCSLNINTI